MLDPVLNGAMASLKGEASKAKNEKLKVIAKKILEHQEGQSLASQQADKEIATREEAITLLVKEAQQVSEDYAKRWGSDEKSNVVPLDKE
jgi:hypothetical protein